MRKLHPRQYDIAAPVFAGARDLHAGIDAVLNHVIQGEVWVDDIVSPSVALLSEAGEGYHLAGDSDHRAVHAALRATIPHTAYLIPDRPEWGDVLARIWDNPFARPHPRKAFRATAGRRRKPGPPLPEDFRIVPVDEELYASSHLANHDAIADPLHERWASPQAFFDHGVGCCVLTDDAIVSHCLADSVVDDRCELGVGTEEAFRGRGLAAAAVAATVAVCLEWGVGRIGWHCHGSNAGSIRLAEGAGLVPHADYIAFSSTFPAENAGDLPAADCVDWAEHYEAASEHVGWYAFHAAGSWALAGDIDRAFASLRRLVAGDWQGEPEWLESHWTFAPLRGLPELAPIVAAQRAKLAGAPPA